MRRILCIHLPHWPIQRLLAAHPAPDAARPIILYARDARRRNIVTACNSVAYAQGVRSAMPLVEAAALAGEREECHVAPANSAADLAALARLAEHCERFSPLVGWQTVDDSPPEPDRLLLDITGSRRHWSDEVALVREVVNDLAQLGYTAGVAVADTIGAALARAAFAEPLPVSALRVPEEAVALLSQLGIAEIEQLVELPRASLLARFGELLVRRLGQFLGTVPEAIVAHRPPPQFVVEQLLEYPIESRELLEHVLRQLVERIALALAERGEGAMRLSCRLECMNSPATWEIGLFRPSAQPEHLWDLLRMPLERLALPGPVERVTLAAPLAARLENCQRELFTDSLRQARRQAELLIDRLSSRLGPENVVRALLVADPLPERAVEYVPAIEADRPQKKEKHQRRAIAALARPLLLHAPPLALETISLAPDGPPVTFRFRGRTQRVARSWGPERIESGWWRGPGVRRDYYRVEVESGERYWLFRRRRDGQWFLHGEFA